MSGIASSVGLVSGIDYTTLVAQLMKIERLPITYLENRTKKLENEETAITSLTARFLTTSYMIQSLNKATAFDLCAVSSSNDSLLKATKSGTPTNGVYTFTPIQTAMAQQTVVKGVASDSEALGKTGTITIGKGWSLDGGDTYLTDINGGDGFSKGYIRITDGSGTRATIDLRSCVTVNDVIKTINETSSIDVWAELDGDSFKLTDMSGGTANIKVQEVNNGSTAASLGLANLEGSGSITGQSVNKLGLNTKLNLLNDGNGLSFDNVTYDLTFTSSSGATFNVDFNELVSSSSGTSKSVKEVTMGDVIKTINTATGNNGKIVASIGGADGKSLVLTDTTRSFLKADPIADAEEGDPQFSLPTGYDPSDYDIDNDGYVVYAAGNSIGGTEGAKIEDPNAPLTRITQPRTSNPVLRSLGLIDGRYSSSEPVTFSGSVTSRSLLGTLDSPLMASLNGGYGMSNASAGLIQIQDRAGNSATVTITQTDLDLMQSGSLKQAMTVLNEKMETATWTNASGNFIAYGDNVGIRLDVNDAKTGLKITDKSGGSSHNLVFENLGQQMAVLDSNGDPVLDGEGNTVWTTVQSNIIGSFGFTNVNTASSTATGSSLHLQVVSVNTKLADMNGGQGLTLAGGQITITDSSGASSRLYISAANHKTLGDIIADINTMRNNNGPLVTARINDNGDGIEILDSSNGPGTFSIMDGSSSSKICSQLRINKTVTQADKAANGGVMSIAGSTTYSVDVVATDSLDDVRKKINDLGGNFSATVIVDGSSTPYRLVVTGTTTGAVGAMNIDLSCLGLSAENLTEAQDALLVYGDANSSSGIMLSSATNTFKNVVNGIDLTIAGTSTAPITITSAKSSSSVKAYLTQFVTNYNTFREELNVSMYYDPALGVGNVLYNNRVAREFDRVMSDALLKQDYAVSGINSLRSLGITVRSSVEDSGANKSTGKLEFDETVFDELWEKNSEGIKNFFFREMEIPDPKGALDADGKTKMTTVKTGWAESFMKAADSMTGDRVGKAYTELATLDRKITQNYERIDFMEARLAVKEQQMMKKFYAMEMALAQMSSDMSTISSISSNWSANTNSAASYY